MDINKYNTLVFDCDGVILNSNKIKSRAFYEVALAYGEEAAQMLLEYHLANGGVSRYHKFEKFLREMVSISSRGPSLVELIATYATEVRKGLMTCEFAENLVELRNKTSDKNWLIISGGDQVELREVFSARGLDRIFDGGIFGSPDSKDFIFQREVCLGNIRKNAVFFGDSRYDFEMAKKHGIDFGFVSGWSEWTEWQSESSGFTCLLEKLDDLC